MVRQIVTSELRRRTKVKNHLMDKRAAAVAYEMSLIKLKDFLNEQNNG